MKSDLTAERLREVLHYDPASGVFKWRVSTSRCAPAGEIAGGVYDKGYRLIRVDGRLYRAHRLAWLHQTGEWPNEQIDHINLIKSDNRFANLRVSTHSQNKANCRVRANSASGLKGVYFDRRGNGRWRAQIRKNGKQTYLGQFSTPEQARAAYASAAVSLHGEYARLD